MYQAKTGLNYVDICEADARPFKNNKVISLFSGAGGLDIGLEEAGFQTAVCVEIDEDCRATLKKNRDWFLCEKNGVCRPGDIKGVTAEELLKFAGLKKGEAALVVGGAPCQPFSNIGKKFGINDKKDGDLFLDFVKIVKGVQPKAFIFENVQGITHAAHQEVISYMIEKLKGSGYGVSYSILNAADYGVPQRRLRFILMGIKNGKTSCFPLPTHSKNLKSWDTFVKSLDKQPEYKPAKWVSLKKAFSTIKKSDLNRQDCLMMNISDPVKHRMKYIKQGENFKVLPDELRPDCWKSGKHQGADTFGRLKYEEPSITIRTAAYNPSKGRYIHPMEDRGLNTVELARIQGFPEDWKFYCAKNKRKLSLVSIGKQIGNAVPPPVGKALGLAIRNQIL